VLHNFDNLSHSFALTKNHFWETSTGLPRAIDLSKFADLTITLEFYLCDIWGDLASGNGL
jgi:hypothetical protein